VTNNFFNYSARKDVGLLSSTPLYPTKLQARAKNISIIICILEMEVEAVPPPIRTLMFTNAHGAKSQYTHTGAVDLEKNIYFSRGINTHIFNLIRIFSLFKDKCIICF
jgi:hypothetical protein